MSLKQLNSALKLGFRKGDIDVIGRVLLEECRQRKEVEENTLQQLETISNELTQLSNTGDNRLEGRLSVIERQVVQNTTDITALTNRVTALENQVLALESQLTDWRSDIESRLTAEGI